MKGIYCACGTLEDQHHVCTVTYRKLEAALDWALKWHLSRVQIEEGKLGWGHAPSESICDLLNASRDRIIAGYSQSDATEQSRDIRPLYSYPVYSH